MCTVFTTSFHHIGGKKLKRVGVFKDCVRMNECTANSSKKAEVNCCADNMADLFNHNLDLILYYMSNFSLPFWSESVTKMFEVWLYLNQNYTFYI